VITVAVKIPRATFDALKSKIRNPVEPLEAVGQYVCKTGMPAAFAAGGYGTWPSVLREGRPLIDTGALMGGFVSSMGADGRSVVITNTGRPKMIQGVHQFGATIRAKNVPFLRFRIGEQWVSKKQVTIPPRSFFVWFDALRMHVIALAKQRLLESLVAVLR
jgi:phage gpG-like protein